MFNFIVSNGKQSFMVSFQGDSLRQALNKATLYAAEKNLWVTQIFIAE